MREIDGDSFLMNVFLEMIRRNKLEISMVSIIKLEYNFLDLLSDGEKVILKNSGDNIKRFIKKHGEYLKILEKDGETKILISNEEEFTNKLLEEYEQDFENTSNYVGALELVMQEEKKTA